MSGATDADVEVAGLPSKSSHRRPSTSPQRRPRRLRGTGAGGVVVARFRLSRDLLRSQEKGLPAPRQSTHGAGRSPLAWAVSVLRARMPSLPEDYLVTVELIHLASYKPPYSGSFVP